MIVLCCVHATGIISFMSAHMLEIQSKPGSLPTLTKK